MSPIGHSAQHWVRPRGPYPAETRTIYPPGVSEIRSPAEGPQKLCGTARNRPGRTR
ncbi:hypothetical protein SLNWT_4039 [Streptomyces albus]|uniref:Uncharacterized protein n=1 Tax=Streptomyces albus (strain ATCC 21838 / DSM 41398 / FERM P-419 / JCM 4703 / NBRC 107858) TaxID=1081613 RepID=A0A0B5EYI6_STRA4|nr:hypothetical protein SLNWT_4039 [Streptomyces albus]AOU78726.1 hypothetical protein SLNHY_4035 [Streptomyces albus]AYN34460.1 hypothetical protein DUI70_3963 [Streptomyces albus]